MVVLSLITSGERKSGRLKNYQHFFCPPSIVNNVFAAAGLHATSRFLSLPSTVPMLEAVDCFVDATEALCPPNKLGSWQSQQGCLSRVSREAGRILHRSFKRLADHPMAPSFHAAAFTETCNETFFSVVTMSSGAGRMTASTQLEWGQALPRAALRWLRNVVGIDSMLESVKFIRTNSTYVRHSHTVPQYVGLPVPPLSAGKNPKSQEEKEQAKVHAKLVSAARRTVVNLRQLRVRVTSTWKAGTNVGAVYHVAQPVPVEPREGNEGVSEDLQSDDEIDGQDENENDAYSRDDYLQVGDDVAVLAAPKAADGPFWLGRIAGISGEQIKVMWYQAQPDRGTYRKYDGQLDVIGVGAIIGKQQLQSLGNDLLSAG